MTWPMRADSGMERRGRVPLAVERWVWPVAVPTQMTGALELTLAMGASELK